MHARHRRNFEKEVTLDEIYDEVLKEDLGANKAALIQLELECERDFIYGIPETCEFLSRLVKAGKRVAITSDSYLPEDFLRTIIASAIGAENLTRVALYVSSSHGELKATGRLFAEIVRKEVIVPRKILHIGDHPVYDIEKAIEQGINALRFERSVLNRYEEHFAKCLPKGSTLAGYSKPLGSNNWAILMPFHEWFGIRHVA